MTNEELLTYVKRYLRIDFEDDDPLIEIHIGAAKKYLEGAGVQERADNQLYYQVVTMLVALFYENRSGEELKVPAVVSNFITQLGITGRMGQP